MSRMRSRLPRWRSVSTGLVQRNYRRRLTEGMTDAAISPGRR
jgi:hypothetical protein